MDKILILIQKKKHRYSLLGLKMFSGVQTQGHEQQDKNNSSQFFFSNFAKKFYHKRNKKFYHKRNKTSYLVF